MKRVSAALRRLIRRKRVPRAGEQEWLRLILLVRKLQHGQLAFVQRLDDVRALTGSMGSFRADFAELHEQLGAARDSAGALEHGLAERLAKLDGLPDPEAERADVDRRLARLDGLAARLESVAAQAPLGAAAASGELREHVTRLGEHLESLDCALEALGTGDSQQVLGDTLARLEQLSQRLEKKSGELRAGALASGEMAALLARFEALAERLEQAPAALPELPAETTGGTLDLATASRELNGLHAALLCEQESRQRSEDELAELKERLRASELARVELETRHATELTEMADHVQRQLARVEDDLKKKKRGLAELTQQNIALQNQLAQLQSTGPVPNKPSQPAEPAAPLPRGGGETLARLMKPDARAEGQPAADG